MPSLMNKKIAEESKDNICFGELSLQLNTIILIILKDLSMEVITSISVVGTLPPNSLIFG